MCGHFHARAADCMGHINYCHAVYYRMDYVRRHMHFPKTIGESAVVQQMDSHIRCVSLRIKIVVQQESSVVVVGIWCLHCYIGILYLQFISNSHPKKSFG